MTLNRKKIRNSPRICWEDDGFQEKGKQVKLKAQPGETVKAVVIDNCLLSGQDIKKCDGLFIFKNNKNIYIVLVELKGADIETAFMQLASVKRCPEYKKIAEHFLREISDSKSVRLIEKSLYCY